jgi:hypothetical protein
MPGHLYYKLNIDSRAYPVLLVPNSKKIHSAKHP